MPILPFQYAMPFANNGDKNDIPNTANLGNISYNLGWDQTTESPLNLGGTELKRPNFNGVIYNITENQYAYQKGVKNYWRQYIPGTEQTTQEREIYAKGNMVWINKNQVDDSTALLIISKTDNNTEIPVYNTILAGSTNWQFVFDSYTDIVLTRGSRIIKGINETTMKGFLKLDGRIISEAEYNAIPSDIRSEITIVDTTTTPNTYKVVDTRGFDREIYEEEIIESYPSFGTSRFLSGKVTKYSNGVAKIETSSYFGSSSDSAYFYYDDTKFLDKDTEFATLLGSLGSGKTTLDGAYIYGYRCFKEILGSGNPYKIFFYSTLSGNQTLSITYLTKWYENRDLQNSIEIVAGTTSYILDNALNFDDGDVYFERININSFKISSNVNLLIRKSDYKLILNSSSITGAEYGSYDPSLKTLTITGNLSSILGNYYIYGQASKARFTNVQQILIDSEANFAQQFSQQEYTLPPATETTLGGVIVGDGLSVDLNGNLSIIPPDPSLDKWILGNDPDTLYIKYSNGELRYYKKFSLPSGINNNFVINMNFEVNFILGDDFLYTIRIISFKDITTNQIIYSQTDFIDNVESNPNISDPLKAESASIMVDKKTSDEGQLFIEIIGFWKDPTA